MDTNNAAPIGKYYTICSKCQAIIAFLNGYKVDDDWFCGRCYRQMDVPTSNKVNRRGVMVDERST